MIEDKSPACNGEPNDPFSAEPSADLLYVVLYYKSFGRFYDGEYLSHLVNQYIGRP